MKNDFPKTTTPEAEDAVIGSVLLTSEAFECARRLLTPADFADPQNAVVFQACLEMARRGISADPVTLNEFLGASGKKQAGGSARIAGLVNSAALSAKRLVDYCQIVRGRAHEGRMQRAVNKLSTAETPEERDAALTALNLEREQATTRPPMTWPEAQAGRYLQSKPAPADWLFDEVLAAGTVGLVIGADGTGKTWVGIEACMSLAAGRPFGLFRPNRARKCAFISLEDDDAVLHERVDAIAEQFGFDPAVLTDNMLVKSLVGEGGPFLVVDAGGQVAPTADGLWFEASLAALTAEDRAPELILLDTYSRIVSNPDENGNAGGSSVIAWFEKIAKRFGTSILILGHPPKSLRQAQDPDDVTLRGGYSTSANSRWRLVVQPLPSESADKYGINASQYIVCTVTKNSRGRKGQSSVFTRSSEGVLLPAVLANDVMDRKADALVELVKGLKGAEVTRRELSGGKAAGAVAFVGMKSRFGPKFNRQNLTEVVEHAINTCRLRVVQSKQGKATKELILTPSQVTPPHAAPEFRGTVESANDEIPDAAPGYAAPSARASSFRGGAN